LNVQIEQSAVDARGPRQIPGTSRFISDMRFLKIHPSADGEGFLPNAEETLGFWRKVGFCLELSQLSCVGVVKIFPYQRAVETVINWSGDLNALDANLCSLLRSFPFSLTAMLTPTPEHVAAAVDVFCRRAEVPCDGYVQSALKDPKSLRPLTPSFDPVEPFLSKARWIPRLISAFISVDVIYSMIPSDQACVFLLAYLSPIDILSC